jgi:nitrilase
VRIPGPATDLLRQAAKQANTNVVMGLCEQSSRSVGTLFNSQLFIDRNGEIVGVHQKLTPTRAERIVHDRGSGAGLIVPELDFGPASGLICGENTNPLAMFSLLARGTLVHAMSWPDIGGRGRLDRGDRALMAGRAFAFTAKSYVINSVGVLSDEAREVLAFTEDDRAFLAQPGITGGSSIIGPAGDVIAGPLGAEEDILVAELDLERCAEEKLAHDYAGHYNRSDVFSLHVRRDEPRIYVEEPPREG